MTRTGWIPVCHLGQLVPDRGVAALVGGKAVALFLLEGGELRAVGHRDPFTGLNAIARGPIGRLGDGEDRRVTVASPTHHDQLFDLATGECLTEPGESLPVYPVRTVDGEVQVCVAPPAHDDQVDDPVAAGH